MKAKVWTLVISHKHGEDLTVHGTKEEADRALYGYVGSWWRREMGDAEQTGNDEQDARDYFEKTDESANIEEHEIDVRAPDAWRMLERLAEKTRRANSIQHSGGKLEAEDWSELYALTNEAFGILTAA